MPERLRCFVIMPYSQASDFIYREAILPVLRGLGNGNVLPLRADEMGPVPVTLKTHVEDAVSSADFCIADVSGGNLNVMYEVGYAGGLKKPILFVADQNFKKLPANLSTVEVLFYDRHNLSPFREALVSSAQDIVKQLEGKHLSDKTAEELAGVSVAPWGERGYIDSFVASIGIDFSAIVPSPDAIVRIIMPRLKLLEKKKLSIRLVCANPDGEFLRSHARELGLSSFRSRSNWQRSFRQLRKEIQSIPGCNYQLRMTDSAISSSVFLSDDMVMLVPHLAGSGRRSLAVQIRNIENSQLYSMLRDYFEKSWAKSTVSSPEVIRDIMDLTGADEETARELWTRVLDTADKIKNNR